MLVEPHDPLPFPGAAGPAVRRLTQRWATQLEGAARRPRVALVEGTDPRVLWAAARLAQEQAVTPVLVAEDPAAVRDRAADLGLKLPEDPTRLEILRPSRYTDTLAALLEERPRLAAQVLDDPLFLTAAALRRNDVDVCVAGSNRPTADVLRAGLRVVGLAPGIRTLSSSFLMLRPDGDALTYADCAVVVDPDAGQLADIARAAAATHRTLTGDEARAALLSFSTRGSAAHPRVDVVREALSVLRAAAPELPVDGDLQYDAAADPDVGAAKAPGSPVAGRANTFVFPSLEAGNIGYKVAQRVGGCAAIGPFLQGLAAPLHDLSRGCTGSDIAALALAGGVQALTTAQETP
ncbi:phosphate acyltransferase [Streptomyces reniochalinae]|uniref:Recombinase n=1 Tax=Streptomyces reniochalinae TaxID=2250578 RepID=A0A367EQH8_9ACTN|nr:phosphate acyltransferase [Streptomyces reniochalinae]RCG20366.1 recombinase [Streptomyces reniochalinae]